MKKILLAIILTLPIVVFSAQPALAATPAQQSCEALRLQDTSLDCTQSSSVTDSAPVKNILRSIINVVSILVGAISVIMIIIGGFRYVVSGGDSSATKSAKDTILYAVIGLVVVLFAQVIVRFVITQTNKPATPTKKTTNTRLIQTIS